MHNYVYGYIEKYEIAWLEPYVEFFQMLRPHQVVLKLPDKFRKSLNLQTTL